MPVNEYSKSVQDLFEAAQHGEGESLEQFLAQLRPQILTTCYRLLGNVDDAEDAAQEALLAILAGMNPAAPAWQPLVFGSAVEAGLLALFEQGAGAPTAKPSRSANDSSQKRGRRVEPLLTGQMSLQEIEELENFPGRSISTRESLALVFINLLQLLQPEARAVYVLAELLGCEAAVIEQATRLPAARVVEHLSFARRVLEAARAKLPTHALLPSHPLAAKVLRRLGKGLIAQDPMRAVSVLDLNAVLVIPGIGSFTGHEAIATQFSHMFMVGLAPHTMATIEMNGQPALVCFQKKEEHRKIHYRANLIMATTISGRRPNGGKIVRLDMVTESRVMRKIGEAARRVKTK